MARWVCDYCGTTGRTEPGETTDHVLCPVCGEPVVATTRFTADLTGE